MSRLSFAAAAAALAVCASPAFAQEAPAAAPAQAEAEAQAEAPTEVQAEAQTEAPAQSPAEIEMEARAKTFQARMTLLQFELETAITASGGDQTKGMANVDAILARYQPEIEGYATQVETFIDGEIAATTDEAKREEMMAARAQASPALRGFPALVRAAAVQAITALATAPAAEAAPAAPQ